MTRRGLNTRLMTLFLLVGIYSCATSYKEVTGTCVIQEWRFGQVVMRARDICELPPPGPDDVQVRDREMMDVNPFPDLFEENEADTTEENLLEKARLRLMYRQTADPVKREAILEEYRKLDE